jgi:hypothetical protein
LGYFSNTDLPRDLVKTINDPDSLNQNMAAAFIDMRKATGWNVPMFDVKAANIWCSQHKCDQLTIRMR